MKILKSNNSKLDSFRSMPTFSRQTFTKKKDLPEFDFFLEEFLKEGTEEWDDYPILFPRHGHFWDNGYEDVEYGRKS